MPDERTTRDDEARSADHTGIERLADVLVPALVAKLGTLNVGELEVREGEWRIRLRRPAGVGPTYGRRATDRPSRSHPGHEQHGHAPGILDAHRATAGRPAPLVAAAAANGAIAATNGAGGPILAAVGPGRSGADGAATPDRAQIATSPAVGVFQPGPKAVGGTRVRAGDRLGVVDMLGVPQEVVAPADAIVVGVIVDAGTAVEYGQELIHLEPAPAEPR